MAGDREKDDGPEQQPQDKNRLLDYLIWSLNTMTGAKVQEENHSRVEGIERVSLNNN